MPLAPATEPKQYECDAYSAILCVAAITMVPWVRAGCLRRGMDPFATHDQRPVPTDLSYNESRKPLGRASVVRVSPYCTRVLQLRALQLGHAHPTPAACVCFVSPMLYFRALFSTGFPFGVGT